MSRRLAAAAGQTATRRRPSSKKDSPNSEGRGSQSRSARWFPAAAGGQTDTVPCSRALRRSLRLGSHTLNNQLPSNVKCTLQLDVTASCRFTQQNPLAEAERSHRTGQRFRSRQGCRGGGGVCVLRVQTLSAGSTDRGLRYKRLGMFRAPIACPSQGFNVA